MQTVESLRRQTTQSKLLSRMYAQHSKYGIMTLIGYHTGLRISDILRLRVGDIKGTKRIKTQITVKESKTKHVRRILIPPDLQTALKNHLKGSNLHETDFLIYSTEKNKNKPLSRIQAYKTIKKSGREVCPEINVGTHTMRKTFAVELFKRFGSVEAVQRELGHKYASTTLRYLGTNDEIARAILALN